MHENNKIYMGLADTEEKERVYMELSQSNRHGLIARQVWNTRQLHLPFISQLINTGGQVLRRGLLDILKLK